MNTVEHINETDKVLLRLCGYAGEWVSSIAYGVRDLFLLLLKILFNVIDLSKFKFKDSITYLDMWVATWETTVGYLRIAKTQISLRIRADWSVFVVRIELPWILR